MSIINTDESKNNRNLIALVAVERALFSFDRLYSYSIPAELESEVREGVRVIVPFGSGSKTAIGMVFSVKKCDGNKDHKKLKSIDGIVDSEIVLNSEMLDLAKWIKDNTFCTYYNAVSCLLPPNLKKGDELLKKDKAAIITSKIKGETEKIIKLCDNATLINSGTCQVTDENNPDILSEIKVTPKQKAVIQTLEGGSASVKEICYLCGVTASVVENLKRKGIVEVVFREITPDTVDTKTRDTDDITLNEGQTAAFNKLFALSNLGEARCALLHGITGSGKTLVFIKLVGEVLKSGRGVLILVPEISLTPQTISVFKSFFGDNAAVIHSALSRKDRTSEYNRIRNKKARIVIGTRSAVFSPLDDIGLIVIDEEGEHTYKSERSPRYHARDIAKQRCFRHKALLLLASATPSLDSYYRAAIGRYTLVELNERYSKNALPRVNIIDMKVENALGNTGNFSEPLLKAIGENLEKREQSLILLNRRGYHTHVCCVSCGEVAVCPHCNIPLTQHKARPTDGNMAILSCHYCGFLRSDNGRCFNCGSRFVMQTGTGTQRIADELCNIFPSARILRMDADTTMTKGAYEKGFDSFGNHEYDIMVGTQMIAKGLNFPSVTLVGVLLIDNSLYAGDYLGYERTFSLVTQVVGRSGRGEKGGEAFLQTFTPEHYVLELSAKQDYKGFYREESSIRKTLLFPPFCDMCVIEISGVIEKTTLDGAKVVLSILLDKIKTVHSKAEDEGVKLNLPLKVLGPVKNGVGNIGGRFRYRLMIKCVNSPVLKEVISDTLAKSATDKCLKNCRVSGWFDG